MWHEGQQINEIFAIEYFIATSQQPRPKDGSGLEVESGKALWACKGQPVHDLAYFLHLKCATISLSK